MFILLFQNKVGKYIYVIYFYISMPDGKMRVCTSIYMYSMCNIENLNMEYLKVWETNQFLVIFSLNF